jgi:hypothetical protein
MLFSEAWWKMIHEKKPEGKNLMTLALLDDSNKMCQGVQRDVVYLG